MPDLHRIKHSNPRHCALLRIGVVWPLALWFAAAGTAAWADTVVGNGQAASQARSTGEFGRRRPAGWLRARTASRRPPAVVVRGDSNLPPLLESVVESDRAPHLR
jgi:hypothetical protein